MIKEHIDHGSHRGVSTCDQPGMLVDVLAVNSILEKIFYSYHSSLLFIKKKIIFIFPTFF